MALELGSVLRPFLVADFTFAGIHLWGSSLLPGDLLMDLNHIRTWAVQANLIWEAESQFVGENIISQIRGKFDATDRLEVLVNLYENELSPLNYLESPFIPTATLIKHQQMVELVYWELHGVANPEAVSANPPFAIRYGFWIDGIGVECASEVTARFVKEKFGHLLARLQGSYETRVLKEKGIPIALEITPCQKVRARFFKTGRAYDVEFVID